MFTCCCEECVVVTEEHPHDLANWTQVAGTWSVASGYIQTSSSNAILIHDTAMPSGPRGSIDVTFLGTLSASDQYCVILGYLDTNNYIAVQIADQTLSVLQKISGTLYTMWESKDALPLSSGWMFSRIVVCYDGDDSGRKLRVFAPSGTSWLGLTPLLSITAAGDGWGVGTRSIVSGIPGFSATLGRFGGTCVVCQDYCLIYRGEPVSSGELATQFEVISGTWSYTSSKIRATAAGVLVHRQDTSDGRSQMVAGGAFDWSSRSNGDKWRIIVDYVDASNYHFCEFAKITGGWTWRLGKRVAGSESWLSPLSGGFSDNTAHVLINSTAIGLSINAPAPGANTMVYSADTTPLGGDQAGYALVSGSQIDFSGLTYIRGSDSDLANPGGCAAAIKACLGCENIPSQLLLEVSGVTDGTYVGCDSSFNGSFTLDFGDGLVADQCWWVSAEFNLSSTLTIGGTNYTVGQWHVRLTTTSCVVKLLVKTTAGGASLNFWQTTFTWSGADCREIDEAFVYSTAPPGGSECDMRGTYAVSAA